MILPDESQIDSSQPSKNIFKTVRDRHPLRTTEKVHICTASEEDEDGESETHFHFSMGSSEHTSRSDLSCHAHKLDYVSSSNPADGETFSSLRRATVRTLSGEQLPRGQTSGPMLFGDPRTGYTIAYVFRLADMHARGRQRYYALLALAGHDPQRAFEACTMIWALFEQIATHIVRRAEEVASRSALEDSPPERGQITPISNFLIGRATDLDGGPRHGSSHLRANSIAQLVDNDNFFAELHVMFVGMLQELGRLLGGMRIKPVEAEVEQPVREVETKIVNGEEDGLEDGLEEELNQLSLDQEKLSASSATSPLRYSTTPIESPGLVPRRQTVVV